MAFILWFILEPLFIQNSRVRGMYNSTVQSRPLMYVEYFMIFLSGCQKVIKLYSLYAKLLTVHRCYQTPINSGV